jgi:hypothetical protein
MSARPVDWELIGRHYDQLVKYATALRLGVAQILADDAWSARLTDRDRRGLSPSSGPT